MPREMSLSQPSSIYKPPPKNRAISSLTTHKSAVSDAPTVTHQTLEPSVRCSDDNHVSSVKCDPLNSSDHLNVQVLRDNMSNTSGATHRTPPSASDATQGALQIAWVLGMSDASTPNAPLNVERYLGSSANCTSVGRVQCVHTRRSPVSDAHG